MSFPHPWGTVLQKVVTVKENAVRGLNVYRRDQPAYVGSTHWRVENTF